MELLTGNNICLGNITEVNGKKVQSDYLQISETNR